MIIKMFKQTIFILIATFFVACGGATPAAKPASATLPSWYLNPQQSDSSTYYAVGEGANKNEAKLNALNTIAGEISTSVSSSIDSSSSSNTTDAGEVVSKQVKIDLKSSVEKIKFTSAKVIENSFSNGTFYSYVSVDRTTLFNALNKEFEVKYNKAASLWSHMEKHGVFEVFKSGKKLNSLIAKAMPQLSILKAVNSDFDQATYTANLETIQNNAREMQARAVVYVKDMGATPYAELVKKYISAANLNLISSRAQASDPSNLLVVEVSYDAKPKNVKSSDPRLRGASFADVKITIATKNANGKTVAQNIISVLNISKEGYNDAALKTAKFERELSKKGILNILVENSN